MDVSVADTVVICAVMIVFGFACVYSIYLMRAFRWASRESRLTCGVRTPPIGCLHLRMHILKQDPLQTAALASAVGTLPDNARILAVRQTPASESLLRLLEMEQTPVLAVGPRGTVFRISHRLPLQTEYSSIYKKDESKSMYWEDIVTDVGSIHQKVRDYIGSRAPMTIVFYAVPDVYSLVDSVSFPFAINKSSLAFKGKLGAARISIMCFHTGSALGEEPDDSFRGTEDISDLFFKSAGNTGDNPEIGDDVGDGDGDGDGDDVGDGGVASRPCYKANATYNVGADGRCEITCHTGFKMEEKKNGNCIKLLPCPPLDNGINHRNRFTGLCDAYCNGGYELADGVCKPACATVANGKNQRDAENNCVLTCNPSFTLEKGFCVPPSGGCTQTVANGKYVRNHAGVCNLWCEAGYVLNATNTMCGKVCGSIRGGSYSVVDDECVLNCDSDYKLDGSGKKCIRDCGPDVPNGYWPESDLICTSVCRSGYYRSDKSTAPWFECLPSEPPPGWCGGEVYRGKRENNEKGECVIKCDKGFKLVGDSCVHDCGNILPENGKFDQLCSVICDPGYFSKDSKCVKGECSGDIPNGKLSLFSGYCMPDCDEGYIIDYGNPIDQCVPDCRTMVGNGSNTLSEDKTKCEIKCNPGYERISEHGCGYIHSKPCGYLDTQAEIYNRDPTTDDCEMTCRDGLFRAGGECHPIRDTTGCGEVLGDGRYERTAGGDCEVKCDSGIELTYDPDADNFPTCLRRCYDRPKILNGTRVPSKVNKYTCDVQCDEGYAFYDGQCVKECPKVANAMEHRNVDGKCQLKCFGDLKEINGKCLSTTPCPELENGTKNVRQQISPFGCVIECQFPYRLEDGKCVLCPNVTGRTNVPNAKGVCELQPCLPWYELKNGICVQKPDKCPDLDNGTITHDQSNVCTVIKCNTGFTLDFRGECKKIPTTPTECQQSAPMNGRSKWDSEEGKCNTVCNADYELEDGVCVCKDKSPCACDKCGEYKLPYCGANYTRDPVTSQCVCPDGFIIDEFAFCSYPYIQKGDPPKPPGTGFVETHLAKKTNDAIMTYSNDIRNLEAALIDIEGKTDTKSVVDRAKYKHEIKKNQWDLDVFTKLKEGVYTFGPMDKDVLSTTLRREHEDGLCYQNSSIIDEVTRNLFCAEEMRRRYGVLNEKGEFLINPYGFRWFHAGREWTNYYEPPMWNCYGQKIEGLSKEQVGEVCRKEMMVGDFFKFMKSVDDGAPTSDFIDNDRCCTNAPACNRLCLKGEDCAEVCKPNPGSMHNAYNFPYRP